jgi:hypothetical protein
MYPLRNELKFGTRVVVICQAIVSPPLRYFVWRHGRFSCQTLVGEAEIAVDVAGKALEAQDPPPARRRADDMFRQIWHSVSEEDGLSMF